MNMCDADVEFTHQAGLVDVRGPQGSEDQACTAGVICTMGAFTGHLLSTAAVPSPAVGGADSAKRTSVDDSVAAENGVKRQKIEESVATAEESRWRAGVNRQARPDAAEHQAAAARALLCSAFHE